MKKIITFVFLTLLSCSKDSPVPDAVVPTPTLTFTLAVTASEGGSVDISGGTYNENSNVTVTAAPAEGYAFSGWSGDASGSTNPLSVSMTGDKNITASFIRLQYSLSVNIIGSGTVSQVLVESSEKNTDYDPFSTVRLTALPVSNWIFYGWSGSTTETTNEVDIVMEETKSVTATFEEKLSQIIGVDDVFFGNGKWKIRKPKGGGSSSNTIDESSKQMLANCALSEIIFRTDGSFTIISGTTTTTGQFTVDSNTTISLTQAQSPFGTITNLVLTNNFISFSIQLIDGCSEEANGEKDDTYVESEDTYIPPVISLVGSSTIYIGVGDNFTDPGATASDYIDGDLTSSITSSGTVNTATEGTYTIEYSVSDAAGNIASVSRTVIVSLDLPPTITLTGSSTITLLVGDTYIEDGCVATDEIDGDLTSSIITTGTVDTSTVGTYTLVYSITDSASNIVSTTRTVIIDPVCTSATIELIYEQNNTVGNGSNNQTITLGDSIAAINYQLTTDCPPDANGTPLNSSSQGLPEGVGYSFSSENNTIIISGTPSTQGTFDYYLTYYNQTLQSSTVSAVVFGQIIVQESATSTSTTNSSTCTITSSLINGQASQTVTAGEAIANIGYDITTDCQSLSANAYNLPPGVSMTFSNNIVNISGTTTASGTYNYDVMVVESSTTTITLSGTITVNASTNTSTGSISFVNGTCQCPNATVGDTAVINGVTYTAVDNSTIGGQANSGNINLCTTLVTSMQNLFSGKANFNSDIGFWDTSNITNMDRMFENASSFNQNISGWCVSNINSEPTNFLFNSALTEDNKPVWGTCPNGSVDTTPPVISLLGSSTINLTVGNTFTDPGVTATDDVDGDLTSSITVSGSVDTFNTGTYTLTYLVADSSGNQTDVSRTVIISAAATTYSISVTASSNADYTLSGTDANGSVSGDDVSITINSGDTLSFTVDAASHPFYIKTVQGTGTDNQASGVNNNGATNGTVNWTPTTAGTYYYQCSVHNGMFGTITVQ
ncbi:DUF5011 domain-containing protein [Flavobacteriaceae bacterium]|nr:DUF5011 domain-containing protein [Flavobacteriaceae bacterium]